MRDLKHLLYFENLLQEANNELVQKAVKEDGKLALGYTCYHVPEVLLNLDNCVSVRLRARARGRWTSQHTISARSFADLQKRCSKEASRAGTDFCRHCLRAKLAAR